MLEGMTAESCVPLTKVVASDVAPICADDPATKPLPVIASVTGDERTTAEGGEIAAIVGAAFATVKVRAFEEPPPGIGVTTRTWIVVAAASDCAVGVAVRWAASTNVVLAGAPSNVICDPGTKPAPVTVIGLGATPATTELGARLVIDGAGFTTTNVTGVLTPPPGCGFVTTIGKFPVVTRRLGGIVAVRCAPSTNVELTAVPLNETALAPTKPEPTSDTSVAGAPRTALAGATDVTDTVGFVTVNAIVVDAPPPGAGFFTAT
jgi:hypothetical protein